MPLLGIKAHRFANRDRLYSEMEPVRSSSPQQIPNFTYRQDTKHFDVLARLANLPTGLYILFCLSVTLSHGREFILIVSPRSRFNLDYSMPIARYGSLKKTFWVCTCLHLFLSRAPPCMLTMVMEKVISILASP